nr:hypothetical protein [Tanacetum cinerariifolium]
MVKHLDGGGKFLMYPRFVQVFLDNQVKGRDRHNANFVISSHTKKVFANMMREGKDFSRKITPFFAIMMVQALEEQKSRRKQRKEIEVPSPSSEIPNEEGVPTTSNDPLLSEAKTAQAKEIASLKKRVKKMEHKRKSRTLGLKILRKVGSAMRVESSSKSGLGDKKDASKQGKMINNIDQDIKITLVDDTQGRMIKEDMFRVNDLDGDEVFVDVSASEKVEQSVKVIEKEVSTADIVTTAGKVVTTTCIKVTTAATSPQISKDELTLAQTLIEIKVAKPKAITFSTTTVTVVGTRPKEKGIPKNPLKRKDQIMIDEEFGKNLEAQMQAELEEERLASLKEEETNIALIESWVNTQATMDAYYELELMVKRKKHFIRLRAEKIRSKPPTKAQKRNQMCTYLKNMVNYKHNQLKNKSFEEIQMLFNNTINRSSKKAEEGSSKRARSSLEQEDAKRQRLEEENESKELKRCLEIVPEDDDDVIIKATPLSSKSLTIVDYKIYKERKKSNFKIIRAEGIITYEAAASLLEYELMKILLYKMKESKSHLRVDYEREFYDALVKSYNTSTDLFETYGKVFTLKRSRDKKDK